MKLNLFIRGSTWYCDARTLGYGIFTCKTTSKTEAKLYALNKLAQDTPPETRKGMSNAFKFKSKGITLDEAFNRAMRSEWKGYAQPKSIEANHSYCLDFFGSDRYLHDIDQRSLADFKLYLESHPRLNSVSTINKKIFHLSGLMKLAREQWGYDRVPKLHLNTKTQESTRMFIYSESQLEDLLDFLSNPSNGLADSEFMYDLVLFLSETGCRLSEALRFNLGDYQGDFIKIWKAKGDKPRGIPVSSKLKAMLDTGKRLDFTDLKIHQVENRFRNARKSIPSLPQEADLHSLRHTFATRMCESGIDIQVVQHFLGHTSIKTTMIYAKMTDKRTLDAMQLLEASKAKLINSL